MIKLVRGLRQAVRRVGSIYGRGTLVIMMIIISRFASLPDRCGRLCSLRVLLGPPCRESASLVLAERPNGNT